MALTFGQLVERYEAPSRLNWQQPDKVIGLLGTIAGQTIADIGAGTGYFSYRLAQAGASVIAIDIDERFLQYIEKRKSYWPDSVSNRLETRKASRHSSGLAPQEVQGILMVNTYLYIEDRPQYFQKLRTALRPQGWLMIVEYKPGPLPVGPSQALKVPVNQVINELESAGFTSVSLDEISLSYQNIFWVE